MMAPPQIAIVDDHGRAWPVRAASPAPARRPPLTEAQRARVAAKAVDRWWLASGRAPMPHWCEAGEAGDETVTRRHADTRPGEIIQAWRCLFANTDLRGRPLVQRGHLWWARYW